MVGCAEGWMKDGTEGGMSVIRRSESTSLWKERGESNVDLQDRDQGPIFTVVHTDWRDRHLVSDVAHQPPYLMVYRSGSDWGGGPWPAPCWSRSVLALSS